jgi:hypothetical protein
MTYFFIINFNRIKFNFLLKISLEFMIGENWMILAQLNSKRNYVFICFIAKPREVFETGWLT